VSFLESPPIVEELRFEAWVFGDFFLFWLPWELWFPPELPLLKWPTLFLFPIYLGGLILGWLSMIDEVISAKSNSLLMYFALLLLFLFISLPPVVGPKSFYD